MEKRKSFGAIAGSFGHTYRTRETPNADPARSGANRHWHANNVDAAMGNLRRRLPEKRRKDAVLAIEVFMGTSPEFWITADNETKNDWIKKSRGWLETTFGADNVVQTSLHVDEKTPHLTAMIVPVKKDGTLSAKSWMTNKKKMSEHQTSYHASVEACGLDRGLKGSKAKHTRVGSFYGALDRSLQGEKIDPAAAAALRVAYEDSEWQAVHLRDQIIDQNKQLEKLETLTGGLSVDQVKILEQKSAEMREENRVTGLRKSIKSLIVRSRVKKLVTAKAASRKRKKPEIE